MPLLQNHCLTGALTQYSKELIITVRQSAVKVSFDTLDKPLLKGLSDVFKNGGIKIEACGTASD